MVYQHLPPQPLSPVLYSCPRTMYLGSRVYLSYRAPTNAVSSVPTSPLSSSLPPPSWPNLQDPTRAKGAQNWAPYPRIKKPAHKRGAENVPLVELLRDGAIAGSSRRRPTLVPGLHVAAAFFFCTQCQPDVFIGLVVEPVIHKVGSYLPTQ